MKRLLTLLIFIAVVVAASTAWRHLRPAPVPETPAPARFSAVGPIRRIADRLYVVGGGGCNTAVFVTNSGVILVDTKYKEAWPALMREIRTITDKPVTHVINSHRHPDHAEGNTQMPDGITAVIHRSVANAFKALPPILGGEGRGAWHGSTQIIVDHHVTLLEGDDAVDVYFFGPAHTAGDVFTLFRKSRVVHVGDVMRGQQLPTIVHEGGGNGATFVPVLERAIETFPDVTQVITGHGTVVSRQEFLDYTELMRLLTSHVRTNMRFGSDKARVFRSFQPPEKFKNFDFSRQFATMDEIDRSLRPWWQRVW